MHSFFHANILAVEEVPDPDQRHVHKRQERQVLEKCLLSPLNQFTYILRFFARRRQRRRIVVLLDQIRTNGVGRAGLGAGDGGYNARWVTGKFGPIPFVLALNKSDLSTEWSVAHDRLEALRDSGAWTVVRTSARSGDGVPEVFSVLANQMVR